MAIIKERLQKLIEKGATVYSSRFTIKDEPGDIWLTGNCSIENNILNVMNSRENGSYRVENLYEHKADAEWDLEFGKGKVTRTEELNLKNWNELNEYRKESDYYSIRFVANPFNVDIQYLFSVDLKNNGGIYICKEVDGELSEVLFDKLFNEENYTEACRLIKKLFMGEE